VSNFLFLTELKERIKLMTCPYCGEKLTYVDYYGIMKSADHYYIRPQSWIEEVGEIFKCSNEKCEMFDEFFYTDHNGYLKEGYPC
jgi:hypothetical protein